MTRPEWSRGGRPSGLCRLGLLVCVAAGAAAGGVAPAAADEFQELLRNRIEAAGIPPRIVVAGELIHCSTVLPRFYLRRLFRPAWSDARGPRPPAPRLVAALRAATREGLDPAAYHVGRLEALLTGDGERQFAPEPWPLSVRVDLDLLLTDAFLLHASHLLSGRVDPRTFDPTWYVVTTPEVDLTELLEGALRSGAVASALDGLLPTHPGYARLQEVLARYREIEGGGGWPLVAEGGKLQRGDQGPRVEQTRRRLAVTGDRGPEGASAPETFDAELEAAVIRFQRRHGLEADGVVGRETLAALNAPVSERVRQIEMNLERWRWLPRELGPRHVVVNIPGFELEVVEGDKVVLEMRVVVGKPYRRTPVFSAEMSYLVFSPYWHVPPTIAANDILPAVQKDRGYLAQKGIQVFLGWGAQGRSRRPGVDRLDGPERPEPPVPLSTVAGPAECVGRGQVHVRQPIQRVPPRHPLARAVPAPGPDLQLRMHPPREAARAGGVPPPGGPGLGIRGHPGRRSVWTGADGPAAPAHPRPPPVLDGLGGSSRPRAFPKGCLRP